MQPIAPSNEYTVKTDYNEYTIRERQITMNIWERQITKECNQKEAPAERINVARATALVLAWNPVQRDNLAPQHSSHSPLISHIDRLTRVGIMVLFCFKITCIYSMGMCTSQHTGETQRTTWGGFSPSTVWVSGIELRSVATSSITGPESLKASPNGFLSPGPSLFVVLNLGASGGSQGHTLEREMFI